MILCIYIGHQCIVRVVSQRAKVLYHEYSNSRSVHTPERPGRHRPGYQSWGLHLPHQQEHFGGSLAPQYDPAGQPRTEASALFRRCPAIRRGASRPGSCHRCRHRGAELQALLRLGDDTRRRLRQRRRSATQVPQLGWRRPQEGHQPHLLRLGDGRGVMIVTEPTSLT